MDEGGDTVVSKNAEDCAAENHCLHKVWFPEKERKKLRKREANSWKEWDGKMVMINVPGGTARAINSHPGITSLQVAKYDSLINFKQATLCLHERKENYSLPQTVFRETIPTSTELLQ